MGLKSRPIPAPPPLRGGKNLHGAKWGGAGQAGREKIAIPSHAPSFVTTISGNFEKLGEPCPRPQRGSATGLMIFF